MPVEGSGLPKVEDPEDLRPGKIVHDTWVEGSRVPLRYGPWPKDFDDLTADFHSVAAR